MGETGIPLQVRTEEHQRLFRMGETGMSCLAQHTWEEVHRNVWNSTATPNKEDNATKGNLLETAYTAITPTAISTPSLETRNVWLLIIRERIN
ncbi:hypothetical protein Trydic_g19768 [Trypoxylus dichotomus]